MEERRLPTWEELMAWVSGKPEDEVVGIACEFMKCPLATYQKEKYHEPWKVGGLSACPLNHIEIALRPEDWHTEVMKRVDDFPEAVIRDVPVTAKQFKEVLESMKP